MSKWISVKDKLPSMYKEVWIYTSTYGVRVGCLVESVSYADGKEYLRTTVWQALGLSSTIPLKRVTHWMPLPEPHEAPNLD